MNKEFEFKKLIKGKGFFCKISYEFDTIESLILNFDCQIDTKWYGALLFGTNYFYEKYALSKNNGIKIIIKDIEDQIIDTSNMVVFLCIIELLSMETQFIISGFELNHYGDLIIPK